MNSAIKPHNKPARIESLYLLKAISSFFVVMIHSAFFLKEDLTFILGVGTPCFLAITGYLLYSNDCAKELKKCIKWAIKLFRLSISCMVIYLLIYCPLIGMDWSWKTIIINILTGSRICFVLWYLTAMWQALLIFWVIRKHIPKLIIWLPLILIITYILRVHPDYINLEFLGKFYISERNNALITSLPFLSVGYLIHQHKEKLLRAINVNIWLPITIIALFIEFQIRVYFDLPRDYFSFLSFPCIFLLILTCVRHSQFKLPILNAIGEKHSANIYYFHMLIIAALHHANITSPYEAAIVWICCIPLSIIFNYSTAIFSHLMKKASFLQHS